MTTEKVSAAYQMGLQANAQSPIKEKTERRRLITDILLFNPTAECTVDDDVIGQYQG